MPSQTLEREYERDELSDVSTIRVLLADDHPLLIAGLRRLIEGFDDLEIVGTAHSGPELMRMVERRSPDVVLTDLRMPGIDGFECIAQIRESWPSVRVVVLSACDDRPSIDGALAAGASAYIIKSAAPADIGGVIRQAAGGAVFFAPAPGRGGSRADDEPAGPTLTDRERAILSAVSSGMKTAEISRELWLSEHTVKFHLTNIYRKLSVTNRAAAVRYAVENGIAA